MNEYRDRLKEGIVRPLEVLPVRQKSNIAISIFPEKDENSKEAFENHGTYREAMNSSGRDNAHLDN